MTSVTVTVPESASVSLTLAEMAFWANHCRSLLMVSRTSRPGTAGVLCSESVGMTRPSRDCS